MSKITLTLGLSMALGLVLAFSDNTVSAHGGRSGGPHASGYRVAPYSRPSFTARHYPSSYRGWSSYCWFPRYRCYGYYCPTACCWYYWYPQSSCYLPCTYLPTYVPTPIDVAPPTAGPTPSPGAAPTPGLPEGATTLPSGAATMPPAGQE
jgi:hypothetical protein